MYAVQITGPITDEVKQVMQEIMDKGAEDLNNRAEVLAQQLGISEGQAASVLYLRTRSRWTQALEDRLLQHYKDNIAVNIMEFG